MFRRSTCFIRSIVWYSPPVIFSPKTFTSSTRCQDTLRKALYPNYYLSIEASHVEHCIEHLRQAILCTSGGLRLRSSPFITQYNFWTLPVDLSPIVYRWDSQTNSVITDSRKEAPHMCRDFKGLHNWAKSSENSLPYEILAF